MAVSLGRPRPVGAFFRKELLDAIRQPWLLGVMVLGPFLVLAIFAVGYQRDIRPYRTVFVGDPEGPVAVRLEASADRLSEFIEYKGVTANETAALDDLENGELDAVVVLPDDPFADVLAGEQSALRVVHRRLDPIEQAAIQFASRLAVDEINAEVLAAVLTEGQEEVASLTGVVERARGALDDLLGAIDEGDTARADEAANEAAEALGRVDVMAALVDRLAEDAGESGDELAADSRALADLAAQAQGLLGSLRAELQQTSPSQVRAQADEVVGSFDELMPLAEQIVAADAEVLVRPFRAEVDLDVEGTTALADFYAPAAVVLLLQQFGVAFAALSFVRERQLGIVDVYRVSPTGSLSMLVGKYAAYVVLGGFVAAALLGLVVAVTGVPFRGRLLDAAAVLALLLLASVGLGFLISLVSGTDTQAVLLTMLVLLASLFFTGFFLSVEAIAWPFRLVTYLLPATYGVEGLRTVQLQGGRPETADLLLLGAFSLAVGAVVLLGSRRSVTAA